jgi:acyl-CoA thioester hydrolase
MAEKPNTIKLPVTYWKTPVHVLPSDFDELGHVNNVMYLRYVQEVSANHWKSLATEEQLTSCIWVVGRHEIDYNHAIHPDDEVVGLTWVHPPQGMRFARSVWLVSPGMDKIYAQAYTIWLLLHKETGKPRRVDNELLESFKPWMADR